MSKKYDMIRLPERCPICGSNLIIKSDLDRHDDGTYDELWECERHHLFRVIYIPVKFVRLEEVAES